MRNIGFVIIGRNEGFYLHEALDSIISQNFPGSSIVYVDSGSSDNSLKIAQSLNINIVELSTDTAFTAARARNEGFSKLIEIDPDIEFVQFMDADCKMYKHWIDNAMPNFCEDDSIAIVCGLRKELKPDLNLFNSFCDNEWNEKLGYVTSCGGDFIIRKSLFEKFNGFNEKLIAGEEPEFCYRLRSKGFLIKRIECKMTLHDANIQSFGQWWKRAVRTGYAYAESFYLYRKSKTGFRKRECLSIIFWNLLFYMIFILSISVSRTYLFLLFLYPVNVYKIHMNLNANYLNKIQYSVSIMFQKFAQFQGIITFLIYRVLNKKHEIIEYKN